jgi:hypothetical protein
MDIKDKKIKDLQDKLSIYEDDIAGQFYKALASAVKYINKEIETKRLNLETDTFAKSVVTLADKSSKIFEGLKNGKAAFAIEDEPKEGKKSSRSETSAI